MMKRGLSNTILTPNDSSEWHTSNSPRTKKAKMSKSKIKTTLICFFDSQGFVHKEFVPQGQTTSKQYYHEILERLRKRVHRFRPEIAELGCYITTMLPVTLSFP